MAATETSAGREVRWTDAAIADLKWQRISKAEWQVIRREVERIAHVHNIRLDRAVCRVAQTEGLWSRIKITEPCQLRVFFSEDGRRIIVQAVLRRSENTYNIAEILWRAA